MVAATTLLATVSLASDSSRPNVVLIMTDNHGAWTLGCYGNPDIRTPNIDRLAAEGTLFTRAFASNPVCSPTRATVLTGLMPSQHGVHSFLSGGRLQVGPDARCTLDELTSLPEVLREAGYDCGLVGKWHLGDNLRPQEGLDDYWITMPHGGTSTFYNAQVIENGEIRSEPKYLTDLWTQHAIKFIDSRAGKEAPFFLFLSYNGPYSLSRLLLRDGKNRHREYYADKELASFPRTKPHPWQLNNRDYINNPTSIRRVATEVSGVDDGVGDVMKALETHGLDEDTLVVFIADQGWVGGHGGFFGMGDHTRPLTARDGMMQIPLIWRHPERIASGVRRDQLIANYDVMPTLLGHLSMGESLPSAPKSPGRDFSALLTAPATSPVGAEESDSRSPEANAAETSREAVYYEFENLRCVRTATHKYIHRHPNGPHELYDLASDPDEFVNLVGDARSRGLREQLKQQLDAFFAEYSVPKYDMWNGGTSQVRIHDGVDEEIAQLSPADPPPLSDGFMPAPISVPDGFSVELAAGPPLVTHPTMACFDDIGRLYVCNNAGVNMTSDELEKNLPNTIRRLVDSDGDGRFDSFTVFADKMTFPMGGVWQDGSLYVASPPNIWRLTDTDDDGVADQREIIVDEFGYTGNAASIHGCFTGPDGRLYWTDGYHGHEFKDEAGNITSKREGSYLFSCRGDGSDARIHCGGGMDNPVEVDFTDSGDMLGTVNILYTRPRVDCLVHWLHGGAYPHRERVLGELKVTGDLLGPVHRFGHVAVSGLTRYRSGVMDHRWSDDLFATFFNSGKVVRLGLAKKGSTYDVTQHEFLSSSSREFHPTDVLEDADGSLLVVDTGGWFYRGCPTSQYAKPELLGGIYRVRRDGMTTMVDPRGLRIDWQKQSPASLVKLLNDTRFAVRQQAIERCAARGEETLPLLRSSIVRSDIRVRRNAVWALSRMATNERLRTDAREALRPALKDADAAVRQAACRAIGEFAEAMDASQILPLLADPIASVRRGAATVLGKVGDRQAIPSLVAALDRPGIDRSEEHALVYALIEIGDSSAVRSQVWNGKLRDRAVVAAMTAVEQIDPSSISYKDAVGLMNFDTSSGNLLKRILKRNPQWADDVTSLVGNWIATGQGPSRYPTINDALDAYLDSPAMASLVGQWLESDIEESRALALGTLARAGRIAPSQSWVGPLRDMLQSSDERTVRSAMMAVAGMQGNEFAAQLDSLAADQKRSMTLRTEALTALVKGSAKLEPQMFERLLQTYRESGSPTAAAAAARLLGVSQLTAGQLEKVAPLVRSASPGDLRELLRAFQRNVNHNAAEALLESLESADSFSSIEVHEFSDVVKRFPTETLDRANRLLDRLKQHHQTKLLRLQVLRDRLDQGDAGRGKQVFHSEKAKCSSCHRIGDQGKAVGPDLSTIGANRSAIDLLESMVFPSASIVRDYETHKVLTVDGRALTGLVIGESADDIRIQQASGEIIAIAQGDIESIAPSSVSIMPAGLDETLTEDQLLDVVKYLQSLTSHGVAGEIE